MDRFVDILLWPLLACVSIGLLHSYAGLHVLRRGVIFVDLALAQMAALGAVIGMVVTTHETHAHIQTVAPAQAPAPTDELDAAIAQTGQVSAQEPDDDDEQHSQGLFDFWPTAFALAGALILAFGRVPGERVPHEAIIGIVYVVAAAATILILSKAPHGHEQMEEMLTGKLLFVSRSEVITTTAIYVVLGVLHWLFRRQFLAISKSSESAAQGGLRVYLWDCLFYAMFAVMVTRSVAIGGVLIVFSFLIIPGACASMLVDAFRARIFLAWVVATVVSLVGVSISAVADLPTGATLVATFGAALIVCIALSAGRRAI